MFTQVLLKVSVLFVILFIGGLARHKRLLTEESTRALAQLVLVITLPFLYFHSLATRLTPALFRAIWILPIIAVILVLMAYVIANIFSRFLRLGRSQKTSFVFLATFTNCGFLAIPIANVLYGIEGVIRVVLFNVGFNLLYWTLGVWILKRISEGVSQTKATVLFFSKNLINSGTIGLISGVIVGLAAFKLPSIVLEPTAIIGSATIPLALLVVGSIMSKAEIEKLRTYRKPILLIILCRLIIVPALALFLTSFFDGLSPLTRAIVVLQAAMPSASTAPIFMTRFGGDLELASAGIFATTALSVITIPVFISLL